MTTYAQKVADLILAEPNEAARFEAAKAIAGYAMGAIVAMKGARPAVEFAYRLADATVQEAGERQ